MNRFSALALTCLVALAVLASACNKDTPTEPTDTTTTTTTTTSTTVSKTETFTGTLVSGSSDIHTFHTLAGTVTTALASIDPTTFSAPIGLGVGTWDGTTCGLVLASASATVSTSMVGTASIETDLCVKVYDPGNLAPGFALAYQVTVTHMASSQ